MTGTNRQWLLAKRPVGMVGEEDFELVERPIEEPGEGQVLQKTRVIAFEPAMRGWISDKDNYIRPVGIGEVMRSMAVSEVVESRLEGLEPGDLVSGKRSTSRLRSARRSSLHPSDNSASTAGATWPSSTNPSSRRACEISSRRTRASKCAWVRRSRGSPRIRRGWTSR